MARMIAEALALHIGGAHEAAAGHYANAIEDYRIAWCQALQFGLNPNGTKRVQSAGNNSLPATYEVAPEAGLEPATFRLTAGRSTIELLWMPERGAIYRAPYTTSNGF
jgi:hypothetical protein